MHVGSEKKAMGGWRNGIYEEDEPRGLTTSLEGGAIGSMKKTSHVASPRH